LHIIFTALIIKEAFNINEHIIITSKPLPSMFSDFMYRRCGDDSEKGL